MGGDGLLGALAGELQGTDAVLGVVPGGRGNDWARKLGIGEDPAESVAVLAAGNVRSVDRRHRGRTRVPGHRLGGP